MSDLTNTEKYGDLPKELFEEKFKPRLDKLKENINELTRTENSLNEQITSVESENSKLEKKLSKNQELLKKNEEDYDNQKLEIQKKQYGVSVIEANVFLMFSAIFLIAALVIGWFDVLFLIQIEKNLIWGLLAIPGLNLIAPFISPIITGQSLRFILTFFHILALLIFGFCFLYSKTKRSTNQP